MISLDWLDWSAIGAVVVALVLVMAIWRKGGEDR